MRADEFLTERVSSKIFHYTSVHNAYKIMTSQAFRLSAAGGTQVERDLQKGKLYYLSTARSPSADYTISNSGYFGAVFNLNGDWFNQRHKGAPVDYWERMWWDQEAGKTQGGRTSEQEDRILSDQPVIKMGAQITQAIESIHVLAKDQSDGDRFGGVIRGLLLEAKKLRIPIYLYADKNAFLVQNTAKAMSVQEYKNFLSAKRPVPFRSHYATRDDFKKWRELYFKSELPQLSKEARDELYNISNYSDRGSVLDNDIHNGKSDDSPALPKLMAIFRKIGVRSGKEYVEWLRNKWKDKV